MTSRFHSVAWLLAVLVASTSLLLIVGVRPTSAYEGAFCEDVSQAEGTGCESQERSEVAQASGHTTDAYSNVAIEVGSKRKTGDCRTIECTAGSGYVEPAGKGWGTIVNAGPNGTRKVYGHLNP